MAVFTVPMQVVVGLEYASNNVVVVAPIILVLAPPATILQIVVVCNSVEYLVTTTVAAVTVTYTGPRVIVSLIVSVMTAHWAAIAINGTRTKLFHIVGVE